MTTTTTRRAPTRPGPTDAIRPFHLKIDEEALVDLRRRIAAIRWPDRDGTPMDPLITAAARARCVVAEAEIALVSRDLAWPAKALRACS